MSLLVELNLGMQSILLQNRQTLSKHQSNIKTLMCNVDKDNYLEASDKSLQKSSKPPETSQN